MEIRYISDAPEKTAKLGEKIGRVLKKGDVICLNGELGAGKTIIVKGIAKGLNIKEPVTSPTFTIVNEYYGDLPLYHFDVYRIFDPDEMYDIGFEDYIYGDGVCVIEWGELIKEILPDNITTINIEYLDDDKREINILTEDEHILKATEEMGL